MTDISNPITSQQFAIRNLSVLAYAQGFTLWHYRASALPMRTATSHGFFNAAADMLAAGDMILISASDGGSVVFVASSIEVNGVAVVGLS